MRHSLSWQGAVSEPVRGWRLILLALLQSKSLCVASMKASLVSVDEGSFRSSDGCLVGEDI